MDTIINIRVANKADVDTYIAKLKQLHVAINVCTLGDDVKETWERYELSELCTLAEFGALVKNTLKNA